MIRAAIMNELRRRGRTRYWLAQQIGMQPRAIYSVLGRNMTISTAEAMMKALDLAVTPSPAERRPKEAPR